MHLLRAPFAVLPTSLLRRRRAFLDGGRHAVLSLDSRSQSLPGALPLIPSAAARRNLAAKMTLLHAIQQEVLLQNSDTPKVSLLVPICNVVLRHLRECLDSAVAQTLKDIEIICINDDLLTVRRISSASTWSATRASR